MSWLILTFLISENKLLSSLKESLLIKKYEFPIHNLLTLHGHSLEFKLSIKLKNAENFKYVQNELLQARRICFQQTAYRCYA